MTATDGMSSTALSRMSNMDVTENARHPYLTYVYTWMSRRECETSIFDIRECETSIFDIRLACQIWMSQSENAREKCDIHMDHKETLSRILWLAVRGCDIHISVRAREKCDIRQRNVTSIWAVRAREKCDIRQSENAREKSGSNRCCHLSHSPRMDSMLSSCCHGFEATYACHIASQRILSRIRLEWMSSVAVIYCGLFCKRALQKSQYSRHFLTCHLLLSSIALTFLSPFDAFEANPLAFASDAIASLAFLSHSRTHVK